MSGGALGSDTEEKDLLCRGFRRRRVGARRDITDLSPEPSTSGLNGIVIKRPPGRENFQRPDLQREHLLSSSTDSASDEEPGRIILVQPAEDGGNDNEGNGEGPKDQGGAETGGGEGASEEETGHREEESEHGRWRGGGDGKAMDIIRAQNRLVS